MNFRIVDMPNPVWGDDLPDVNWGSDIHVVEVQLVERKDIVQDPLFIREYSELVGLEPTRYSYRSIRDKVDQEEFTRMYEFIKTLILSLSKEAELVFWGRDKFYENPDETKGELEFPTQYYVIEALAGNRNLNGTVSIFSR